MIRMRRLDVELADPAALKGGWQPGGKLGLDPTRRARADGGAGTVTGHCASAVAVSVRSLLRL